MGAVLAEEVAASRNGEMFHADNLGTAIYAFSHLQQIADPVIFILAEFCFS